MKVKVSGTCIYIILLIVNRVKLKKNNNFLFYVSPLLYNFVVLPGTCRLNPFTVKLGQAYPKDLINEFINNLKVESVGICRFQTISAFLHA